MPRTHHAPTCAAKPAAVLKHPHFDRPTVNNPKIRRMLNRRMVSGCMNFEYFYTEKIYRRYSERTAAPPPPKPHTLQDELAYLCGFAQTTIACIEGQVAHVKRLINSNVKGEK